MTNPAASTILDGFAAGIENQDFGGIMKILNFRKLRISLNLRNLNFLELLVHLIFVRIKESKLFL